MIHIESLKNYVDNTEPEKLMKLAIKIYRITSFICKDYPEYKEWYFKKQLPITLNSNARNILFVRNKENDNEIISVACLKKNTEQKICTLYVSDQCRGLGIGTAVLEESIKWLGTTKPFITFADYKLELFRPMIEKYSWELMEIVSNLYNNRVQELCFNGTITKNKKETLEHQLHKQLVRVLKKRCGQIQKT